MDLETVDIAFLVCEPPPTIAVADPATYATMVTACNAAKVDATTALEAIKKTQFVEAGTAIDNVNTAIEGVNTAANAAIPAANSAFEQANSLNGSVSSAQLQCEEYSKAATATQNANKFSWGKFGGVLGVYSGLGFIGGGFIGNLFGDDPCDEDVTQDLQDWVINLGGSFSTFSSAITDWDTNEGIDYTAIASVITTMTGSSGSWDVSSLFDTGWSGLIEGGSIGLDDVSGIEAELNTDEASVIGQFEQQEVGVVFTNTGIEDPEPVYAIVTINAIRHYHADPTIISEGEEFGSFNVPDEMILPIDQKFHLRFETSDVEDDLVSVEFDAESCIAGSMIGYTGDEVVPRVMLEWDWDKISKDTCDEGNEDYIYCDATQFNMEINYRIERLREFLAKYGSSLSCPTNPAQVIADDLSAELIDLGYFDGLTTSSSGECWMPTTTALYEGRPALDFYIEENEDSISWSSENDLSGRQDVIDLLNFNAYLIQDGYSNDMLDDFQAFSDTEAFFNTPTFFNQLAVNSNGQRYGFNEFYKDGKIKFYKKYSTDTTLNSPGLYNVHINIDFNNNWDFFDAKGDPAAEINVELSLIEEPNVDNPFYRLPFNGNIGMEGDSLNRQGYGLSYINNSGETISINNASQTVTTYNDSGSNAVGEMSTTYSKSFIALNTSPSTRGKLLSIEMDGSSGNMVFQPSRATPLLMKVSSDITEEPFSAFYRINVGGTPADVGSSANYWNGAGVCNDFSGVPVYEAFDEKADRAATETDSLIDWEYAYAIDWDEVVEEGDVYLRTITYASPEADTTMQAVQPLDDMSFITPDEEGTIVALNGISTMEFNSYAGGDTGKITSVSQIFDLVKEKQVCVVANGSTASFYWNPQAIYKQSGGSSNIHDVTESLTAGETCIGSS